MKIAPGPLPRSVNLGGLAKALMQSLALTCSRLAIVDLLVTGCGRGARPEPSRDSLTTNRPGLGTPFQRVRAPAVAGLFYPGDPAALAKAVGGLLAGAPEPSIPPPQGPGLPACRLRFFRAARRHRLQAAGRA